MAKKKKTPPRTKSGRFRKRKRPATARKRRAAPKRPVARRRSAKRAAPKRRKRKNPGVEGMTVMVNGAPTAKNPKRRRKKRKNPEESTGKLVAASVGGAVVGAAVGAGGVYALNRYAPVSKRVGAAIKIGGGLVMGLGLALASKYTMGAGASLAVSTVVPGVIDLFEPSAEEPAPAAPAAPGSTQFLPATQAQASNVRMLRPQPRMMRGVAFAHDMRGVGWGDRESLRGDEMGAVVMGRRHY